MRPIESEDDSRKDLQDPDAPKQLKIDRILGGKKHDKNQCAHLDNERDDLRNIRFLSWADVLLNERLPDVSSAKVRRTDGHDCRRYQRADRNSSKTKAYEPFREDLIEQRGDYTCGFVQLDSGSDRHISKPS